VRDWLRLGGEEMVGGRSEGGCMKLERMLKKKRRKS
jgi:hypothetical protein